MLGFNEALDQLAVTTVGIVVVMLWPQWVLWWSCVDEA